MTETISRAIVLAAGMGTRLSADRDEGRSRCKPLCPVLGVPLIVRVLRQLQTAGISEAVVVLGHRGNEIRHCLRREPSLGLRLEFVENPDFAKKNGMSLLAAAEHVERDCLLSMSDHLYSPELVRRLLAAPLEPGRCALGVDFDIERCFDLDDATKVRTAAGRIQRIGKSLGDFNAIDTGVFRVSPELVDELRAVYAETGDCSLSEGVQRLAKRRGFFAVDIGDARWIDVDTPEALERAQAMIRVFGEALGDEPGGDSAPVIAAESMELFAPTWVRAAEPYNEDHLAVAEERDVVRLMSNESPYAPSPRVINAIVEAALLGNRYPSGAGELSAKIADLCDLKAENVLLGAGSTELIDVAIRTFVAPGEEVLLSVPTFSMYEARTRTIGGIPVLVPMTAAHEHDFGGMVRRVTERTKIVFLCSPNNPTGSSVSEADLRRILRLGLPTVVDEAYVEFGGSSHAGLLNEFPNAIVLRTFSKAYGLAGLRIGYALAHTDVIRLFRRVKVPWNLSAVTLAAASAVLDEALEFNTRLDEVCVARERLMRRLERIAGIVALPSSGNFLLLDVSGTGFSAGELVEAVLDQGVLLRSLSVHHAGKQYVRVTVGTDEQNRRCVAALAEVVARRLVAAPRSALFSQLGDAE